MRNCPDSVIKSQICSMKIHTNELVMLEPVRVCSQGSKAIFGVCASHTHLCMYTPIIIRLFFLFRFLLFKLKIIIILINIEILMSARNKPTVDVFCVFIWYYL